MWEPADQKLKEAVADIKQREGKFKEALHESLKMDKELDAKFEEEQNQFIKTMQQRHAEQLLIAQEMEESLQKLREKFRLAMATEDEDEAENT